MAYFEGEDNSEDQRAHHGNCSHGFGIFPQEIRSLGTEEGEYTSENIPIKDTYTHYQT